MSEEERDRQALMMGPMGGSRGKEMASQSPAQLSTRDQALPILSYCAASIMMTVVNKVREYLELVFWGCRCQTSVCADFSVCRFWRELYNDFPLARYPVCRLCHRSLDRQANGRDYL